MLLLNSTYLDGLFQLKRLYGFMVFVYLYIIYVVYKYPSNHYPDAGKTCKRKCCLNTTVLQNLVCWRKPHPTLICASSRRFFIPCPAGEMQGVKGRGYAALTMYFLTSDSFSFFNHSLF